LILPNISIFTLPGFGKDVVYHNLFLKITLYVVFFPNLVSASLGMVPYASHTWSIGTEEQFYLVWPAILKFFKKHRIVLMVFIIFSYIFIAKFLNSHYTNFTPYRNVINAFWSSFNIDCMAIGGFFAILLFQNSRYLKIFMNKYLFYFAIILVIAFMIKGVYIPYIHSEFYASLFGMIILNFAANKDIRITLETPILNYLGKISYGLYMYHPIGIVLALYFVSKFGYITNWILYPLSIVLTIIIAATSYRYFETLFLRFKPRFSKVISGELIRNKNVSA
jgi:peptidoglycan/LPS O-acetylase OafA/YrhL